MSPPTGSGGDGPHEEPPRPRPDGRLLKLRVTRNAERSIRQGHPWVFDRSITTAGADGASGDLAAVYDSRNRFLAIGLWDPDSPIRLRVLQTGRPEVIDNRWWRERVRAAITARAGLRTPETTGIRIIHGENDGFPGLVADLYDRVLVVKLYTPIWRRWYPSIESALLGELPEAESLVLRLSRGHTEAWAAAGFVDGETRVGPAVSEPVAFLEHGMLLEADVVRGQKTGFFLDHRDNRLAVRRLAHGRRMLNIFSYSGAFSLAAAFGGAAAVTDVDVSRHALDEGDRNFARNLGHDSVRHCLRQTVQADAFEWIAEKAPERAFDLVVVDPPSLAPREKDRPAALAAYTHLASKAIRTLTRPGGILLCASCSAHVRPEEFEQRILDAARREVSPHGFRVLAVTGTPPDHPSRFPEAHYLKAVLLELL